MGEVRKFGSGEKMNEQELAKEEKTIAEEQERFQALERFRSSLDRQAAVRTSDRNPEDPVPVADLLTPPDKKDFEDVLNQKPLRSRPADIRQPGVIDRILVQTVTQAAADTGADMSWDEKDAVNAFVQLTGAERTVNDAAFGRVAGLMEIDPAESERVKRLREGIREEKVHLIEPLLQPKTKMEIAAAAEALTEILKGDEWKKEADRRFAADPVSPADALDFLEKKKRLGAGTEETARQIDEAIAYLQERAGIKADVRSLQAVAQAKAHGEIPADMILHGNPELDGALKHVRKEGAELRRYKTRLQAETLKDLVLRRLQGTE
jgi:hypothetical protein